MRRTLSIVLTIASYCHSRMNEFKPVFSLLAKSLISIGTQWLQVIFNSKNLLANPVFGGLRTVKPANHPSLLFNHFIHARLITI